MIPYRATCSKALVRKQIGEMLSSEAHMYLINGKEIGIYADREIILDSSLFASKKMGHVNVDLDRN